MRPDLRNLGGLGRRAGTEGTRDVRCVMRQVGVCRVLRGKRDMSQSERALWALIGRFWSSPTTDEAPSRAEACGGTDEPSAACVSEIHKGGVGVGNGGVEKGLDA
jgi:hypothetical protein